MQEEKEKDTDHETPTMITEIRRAGEAATVAEIAALNDRLDRIERLLQTEVVTKCNKMSNHIDFIERIYDYVKSPLFYISERVRSLTSKQRIPIEHGSHQAEATDE